jgi:hypothetical protein
MRAARRHCGCVCVQPRRNPRGVCGSREAPNLRVRPTHERDGVRSWLRVRPTIRELLRYGRKLPLGSACSTSRDQQRVRYCALGNLWRFGSLNHLRRRTVGRRHEDLRPQPDQEFTAWRFHYDAGHSCFGKTSAWIGARLSLAAELYPVE